VRKNAPTLLQAADVIEQRHHRKLGDPFAPLGLRGTVRKPPVGPDWLMNC
jgi:hypothetical protein